MINNTSDGRVSSLERIASINHVDGFDPSVFAVDYTDLNTGEMRKRLPIMPLLAWFRLVFPEGKIAVSVTEGQECFIANAKIYPSYKDSPDSYIGEATVSRGHCADKPTVSPREWAQTAAIGVALRNAGFGLQFGMVGDEFLPASPDVTNNETGFRPDTESDTVTVTSPTVLQMEQEPTLEEKAKAAMLLPCPISKYSGKTMGDVLLLDPGAIKWIAEKFSKDEKIRAGAAAICEYAADQAAD